MSKITKKQGIIALCVLLALIIAGAGVFALVRGRTAAPEEGELIVNGGFESASGDLPDGWTVGRWYWDEGVSYLTLSDTAYSGEKSVCVENVEENDARFEQTVAVQPNAWYLISCMARVEGGQEGGVGASVSVKDTFVYSEPVYDTNGEWVRLTLY